MNKQISFKCPCCGAECATFIATSIKKAPQKQDYKKSKEYLQLYAHFKKSNDGNGVFLTTTEILDVLSKVNSGPPLSLCFLGIVLRKEGFHRVKRQGLYGYIVELNR
jgi:hypothetical protein